MTDRNIRTLLARDGRRPATDADYPPDVTRHLVVDGEERVLVPVVWISHAERCKALGVAYGSDGPYFREPGQAP